MSKFRISALLLLSLSACRGDSGASSSPIITIPSAPVTTVAPTPPPPISNVATLIANLSVRQNGIDYYQLGPYFALNNNWGADKIGLVYGKDYTVTVTYDRLTLPKKTEFVWDYPDTPYDNSLVYGYPSVAFGKTTLALSGYNIDNSLGRIKDIATWRQYYDVALSGDLQYMNLMSNVWLFDSTGKIAGEIALSSHPNKHFLYWTDPTNFFGQQPNAHTHEIDMDNVKFEILVSNEYQSDKKVVFVTPSDDNVRITRGNIDWVRVLNLLKEHHDINPDWYVKGVEMGVEVQAGNGSMLVNDFSVSMTYLGQ
jgi:hypothetical protein